MAVSAIYDLVEGSVARAQKGGGQQIIRCAYVTGLEQTTLANVLPSALRAPGMPQTGDAHPFSSNMRVVGHEVKPLGPNQAFVQIIYQDGSFNGPQERLSVRDTTSLSQETIRRHPKTLEALRIYSGDASSSTQPNKIVDATFSLPMRNVVLYGLFDNPRPDVWKKAVGCVNERKFLDLDKGFWLCGFYDEQWSDTDRKYRVTIGFISKQIYDWSTWGQLRTATGDWQDIDNDKLKTIMKLEYGYEFIWNHNGIGRWGFYQTADFQHIFGSFIEIRNH